MARGRRVVPTTWAMPGGGVGTVVRLGSVGPRFNDLYHWFLTTSRARFALVLVGAYLILNGLFALAYLACGNGIANARPGSFSDAFFFSVQTMATIGYGHMEPVGLIANLLVTAEAGIGLFGVAVAAGLMFARFTRPTAGVLFSRNMVVSPMDGQPTLMFRLANERSNLIHEARVHVVFVQDERTAEGQDYRRLRDLSLLRSVTPVFGMSWTVMHMIDEESPLFGRSPEDLAAANAEIVVLFSGHHEAFQQSVHARHSYPADAILWNVRFADLFRTLPDGRRAIHLCCFDEVVPLGSRPGTDGASISPPPP